LTGLVSKTKHRLPKGSARACMRACVSKKVCVCGRVCTTCVYPEPKHEVMVKASKEEQIKVHPVNSSIREMHINQIL
jgi:hypothetical protein